MSVRGAGGLVGRNQQPHQCRPHLTEPAEWLRVAGQAVHDDAEGQRQKRADDAHGRQRDQANGHTAFAAGEIGKQLQKLLPAGQGLGGGGGLREAGWSAVCIVFFVSRN